MFVVQVFQYAIKDFKMHHTVLFVAWKYIPSTNSFYSITHKFHIMVSTCNFNKHLVQSDQKKIHTHLP